VWAADLDLALAHYTKEMIACDSLLSRHIPKGIIRRFPTLFPREYFPTPSFIPMVPMGIICHAVFRGFQSYLLRFNWNIPVGIILSFDLRIVKTFFVFDHLP
jgi:hypothetical protein